MRRAGACGVGSPIIVLDDSSRKNPIVFSGGGRLARHIPSPKSGGRDDHAQHGDASVRPHSSLAATRVGWHALRDEGRGFAATTPFATLRACHPVASLRANVISSLTFRVAPAETLRGRLVPLRR